MDQVYNYMRLLSVLTILILMASGASAAIVVATPGNWLVNAAPATTITTVPGFWTNGPPANWIGLNSSGTGATTPTPYTFTTMIDTTGFQSVSIDLTIWQDDELTSLSLGGGGGAVNTGPVLPAAYNAGGGNPAGAFTLTPVDNTPNQLLTIVVTNLNPDFMGLNVAADITSSPFVPIPEPATFAFVGLGLAGLALVRRRRKV